MGEQAKPNTSIGDRDLASARRRLAALIGQEVGASDWTAIGRDRVRAFAGATGETLWPHTDLDKARAAGFADLVVHGQLLLGLLGGWVQAVGLWLPPPATPRHFGYDRVRFIQRVTADQAVRGRFALAGIDEVDPRAPVLHIDATIEARGQNGDADPAVEARWLVQFRLPDGSEPA